MPEDVDISDFRPQIEAALAYAGGTHTYDDIVDGVSRHALQLWPGIRSVMVTEIVVHPQGHSVNFFLAGGNMAELEAMTPVVLEWAKTRGCKLATLTGRQGWLRSFLTQQGWTKSPLVTLEKVL